MITYSSHRQFWQNIFPLLLRLAPPKSLLIPFTKIHPTDPNILRVGKKILLTLPYIIVYAHPTI